jgi:predicted RNA-binding protein with PIN domain
MRCCAPRASILHAWARQVASEVAVPAAAIPLLVPALGAYMRAAPALDLPPDVRRLRNFHQKTLLARADEVVGILDDENVRALVLQWMDDDASSLPKKQGRALRLAVERDDGWEDALAELAGAARPATPRAPEERLRAALERETAKAAAAKEEARRLKESARKSLADERAAAKELRVELQAARREAHANAADAARARAEAGRLRTDLDRLERRAKKDVAAAKARAEEAAARLRDVRKELSGARRRIAELEHSLEKAARPRPARAPKKDAPRGPRKPLPVPAGRLQDDPGTLDAWLDAEDVHLLVDGYNVTKSAAGFPDLGLAGQRERLVEGLEKLTLRKKVTVTVVYDGSDVGPGKSRPGRRRVRVEYSRSGETADDHLMAKLTSLGPHPVVLVTSDRELQARAGAAGATIAASAQLLELTR